MERRGTESANSRFDITMLKSGPLGGDQQLGAMIASNEIDMLIFFWDPMSAQPHDVDVKALLRLATLYNVPTAINRSSADFMISSTLMAHADYKPVVKDYTAYIKRTVK
jgi:methylglyoxal synthase